MNSNKMPAAMRISLLLSICFVLFLTTPVQAFQITFDVSAVSLHSVVRNETNLQHFVFGGVKTLDLQPGPYKLFSGQGHAFEVDATGSLTGIDPTGPLLGAGTNQLTIDPASVHTIDIDGTAVSLHFMVRDESNGRGNKVALGTTSVDLLPGIYAVFSGTRLVFEVDDTGLLTGIDPAGPLLGTGTSQLTIEPARVHSIDIDGTAVSLHFMVRDESNGRGNRVALGTTSVDLLPGLYAVFSGARLVFEVDATGSLTGIDSGDPLLGAGTSQLTIDPASVHTIDIDATAVSGPFMVRDESNGRGNRVALGTTSVDLLPGLYAVFSGTRLVFRVDGAGLLTGIDPTGPILGTGTSQLTIDPMKVLQIDFDGTAASSSFLVRDESIGRNIKTIHSTGVLDLLPGRYGLFQGSNSAFFTVNSDCEFTPPPPYLLDGNPVLVTCTSGSNSPPVGNAGEDKTGEDTVECTSSDGAEVTLDGSGSSDPDGDDLTFAWSATNITFDDAASSTPKATFPLGITTVTLTVTDPSGESDTDDVDITIEDTIAPLLTIPGNVTVECSTRGGQVVDIGSATGSDACGTVAITSDAPSLFTLGTTTVTWIADDGNGNTTSGTQDVTVVDTIAPPLMIPGDILVECSGPDGQTVLIGTATAIDVCDPNPSVISDAPTLFSLGTTVVTWEATDSEGNAISGTQDVMVVDTIAPSLTIPGNIVVECSGPNGQAVSIGTATGSDACGTVTITSNAPVLFSLGTTPVTWTADDGNGNTTSGTQDVTVRDTASPDVSLDLTVTNLWPPNHKMHRVGGGSVSDICAQIGGALTFGVSVTSNQPINGPGDGNTDPDWIATDNGDGTYSLELRAERSGNMGTRIYTIEVVADDGNGNTTTASGEVHVVHNQGKGKKSSKPVVVERKIEPVMPMQVGPSRQVVSDQTGVTLTVGESRQVVSDQTGVTFTVGESRQMGPPVESPIGNDVGNVDVARGADLTPGVSAALQIVQTARFQLAQNYPNPFNPTTVIRYTLPEAAQVRLVIYNVLGQTVRVLAHEHQEAGYYQVRWDGKNAFGRTVSTGLYLYKLEAGPNVAVRKMIFAK